MLGLVLGLTLLLPAPQGQVSEHQAPVGLTVVMVDVGQGDGLVVRAPDGTIHVIDAGPDGQGNARMLPAIDALQPTGYGYTFLSHFHDDHQGGMDEVLARPFLLAYDRGDVRRTNTSNSTTNYLNAAGGRRRMVTLGQVYPLGGGALIRCVAVNGAVDGGWFLETTGATQEENARSMALRLDYRDFSMWFGGDLTGGGNGTPDIESQAALACGDVDVYKVNHHGSNTSTSLNLVSRLDPELAVVSCGQNNPYGHPTTTTVNRLNQAAAVRMLLSTTTGASNVIGFGAAGNITIQTDGVRYRVSAQNGDCLDFWTDEVAASTPAAGPVRISEIQRNPSRVPDTNGEYVEVMTNGPRPLALKGLRLADNTATVTLACNLMLLPGRPVTFQVDGAAARNGGLPLGVPLPFGSLDLGDTSDTVTLQQNGATVDTVAYGSGWPGGSGVAMERRNLLGSASSGNFAAAVATYGAGDRGSPGRRNDADTTPHGVTIDAVADATGILLRGGAIGRAGQFSLLGVAYGSSPGFPFLNMVVPLNFDPLLQLFLGYPGILAVVPGEGYRSLFIPLPAPNALSGVQLWTAHVALDLGALSGAHSAAMPLVVQ